MAQKPTDLQKALAKKVLRKKLLSEDLHKGYSSLDQLGQMFGGIKGMRGNRSEKKK